MGDKADSDRSLQVSSNGAGLACLVVLLLGIHTNFSKLARPVRKICPTADEPWLTSSFSDSHFARDAFTTFIPMSVESDARTQIIFDFFDLLAAIAAHGKKNGMGGRKLSRYAGWWAFEHIDSGEGFDNGYRSWAKYVIPSRLSLELYG